MNNDQHVCQCKHCGRDFNPATVYFVPSPQPPQCEHEWRGISMWSASDGEHGSRRCAKCHIYEQW